MGLGNCCLMRPFHVTSTRLMLMPYDTTCKARRHVQSPEHHESRWPVSLLLMLHDMALSGVISQDWKSTLDIPCSCPTRTRNAAIGTVATAVQPHIIGPGVRAGCLVHMSCHGPPMLLWSQRPPQRPDLMAA